MSAWTRVVRVAAALLPRHSRDRYREQWLGELRDSPALGIRASEIAMGSLAFAATFARPMPRPRQLTEEGVARRSRRAVALSLSAAAVAISEYASVVTFGTATALDAHSFSIFLASTLLAAYKVLAPIIALVAVIATRGVSRRVRIAVALLTLASLLPLTRSAINGGAQLDGSSIYWTPGVIVYPAALLLLGLAIVTLGRNIRARRAATRLGSPRRSRQLLYSGLGGLLVALAVVLGFADLGRMWAGRTPLVFGVPLTAATRAEFETWLALKIQFEAFVSTIFGVWITVGLALALALAASGLSRRLSARSSLSLSAGIPCLVLISYGGVVTFLGFADSHVIPTAPADLVMLVGQWGLVALVLTTIGRRPLGDSVTFAPGPRDDTDLAHDELLVSTSD